MFTLVYVDYIIVTGSSIGEIQTFISQLDAEFSFKDLVGPTLLLGLSY